MIFPVFVFVVFVDVFVFALRFSGCSGCFNVLSREVNTANKPNKIGPEMMFQGRKLVAGVGFEPTAFRL